MIEQLVNTHPTTPCLRKHSQHSTLNVYCATSSNGRRLTGSTALKSTTLHVFLRDNWMDNLLLIPLLRFNPNSGTRFKWEPLNWVNSSNINQADAVVLHVDWLDYLLLLLQPCAHGNHVHSRHWRCLWNQILTGTTDPGQCHTKINQPMLFFLTRIEWLVATLSKTLCSRKHYRIQLKNPNYEVMGSVW